MISNERLEEIRDYDTCVTLKESAEMAERLLEAEQHRSAGQVRNTETQGYKCSVGDWEIDHSAGRPILLYKKCSVIEAEDAEYIMGLIAKDNKY